jgi:phosphotransferase system HPr (HPr) family protein
MKTTKPQTANLVVERELWVENRLGLHARPAAQISALALQFEAMMTLEKDGHKANARQVLSILTLDSPMGTRLVLRAEGPDAREAATAMVRLFAQKFGES